MIRKESLAEGEKEVHKYSKITPSALSNNEISSVEEGA